MVVGLADVAHRIAAFTRQSTERAFQDPDLVVVLQHAFDLVGELLGPFLLIVLGAAILAAYVQVGALLTTSTIVPDPGRLRPVRPTVAAAMGDVGRGVLMACVSLIALWFASRTLLSVSRETLPSAIVRVVEVVAIVLPGVLAAALLVGVADALVVRLRYERGLRMTRQEREDERRQTEADPVVKSRLRVFGDRAGGGAPTEGAERHASSGVGAATGEVEAGD